MRSIMIQTALRLYGEAIDLDPANHVLYSNRSFILCKLGNFEAALADADKAYCLNPTWVKVCHSPHRANCA